MNHQLTLYSSPVPFQVLFSNFKLLPLFGTMKTQNYIFKIKEKKILWVLKKGSFRLHMILGMMPKVNPLRRYG